MFFQDLSRFLVFCRFLWFVDDGSDDNDSDDGGNSGEQQQLVELTIDEAERRGIFVSQPDPFSTSLSFPRLTTDHSGNYSCVASNAAAQDTHSARLIVNGE